MLVRAGIEEDGPSVPIPTSFKDLGILQHAGKVSTAATTARAQRTFGRLERLAGLPLPLHRRVQAVAAAGVAAAAYGAIAGPPPFYTGGVAAAAYGAIAGATVGGRCLSGSKTFKASMSSAVPQRPGQDLLWLRVSIGNTLLPNACERLPARGPHGRRGDGPPAGGGSVRGRGRDSLPTCTSSSPSSTTSCTSSGTRL